MKKSKSTLIIVAVCLMAAGLLICVGLMLVLEFDFTRLDNTVYVTHSREFTGEILGISVDTDVANISLVPSAENSVKVVCTEKENSPHNITLENGTLRIKNADKHWYEYISAFNFNKSEITLHLPETLYTSLDLNTNTGSIDIEGISAEQMNAETDTGHIILSTIGWSENVNLEADTGHINVSDTRCNKMNAKTDTGHVTLSEVKYHDLICESDTGDITLTNVISEGNINAETDTGDIIFDNSDAVNIYTKSSTGDISGTIIYVKTFSAHSSTGKVDVPNTTGTGVFEAKTSTGDIKISYKD